MDVGLLSRFQFAMTIGFHFLFPPISIGLAWLLVIVEFKAWRSKDSVYDRLGRFFGSILGLTFLVGVVTGIPMEFQFGTNWSRYSKFVGDIFGAPLAAEAVLAFFLESGFLGLYLFGRKRVSKGVHVLAIAMVAVGSTLSAFWIIVADSWMQTPAGFAIQNGRAELIDFAQAVFNPSTMPRFHHTFTAALVCGAFFMAGIAAWLVRKNRQDEVGQVALRIALPVGLLTSILVAFPFGHIHAQQVARTQPEKLAAIEGLYTSQTKAPLVFFAIPFTKPPQLKAKIELQGMLSWMAFGDVNAHVKGINEFSEKDIPPLWLTFVSFHNMVVLGMLFMAMAAWGTFQLWRGKLFASRRFLMLLVIAIPLPLAACQLGWMAAEVGRQPWIVYGVMRTAEAFSPTVPAWQVLFSIGLFGLVYLWLGVLYVYLLCRKITHQAHGAALMTRPPSEPKELVMALLWLQSGSSSSSFCSPATRSWTASIWAWVYCTCWREAITSGESPSTPSPRSGTATKCGCWRAAGRCSLRFHRYMRPSSAGSIWR